MKFDGDTIYTTAYRDAWTAITALPRLLEALLQHPLTLHIATERRKAGGRKVLYRGTPAVVMRLFESGDVLIAAEKGMEFAAMPWEINDGEDQRESKTMIKDDLLSPYIWWFRE